MMQPLFEQVGIKLYQGTDPSQAGNLIVISGHKAESYRAYLTNLGERGALKGKSLALLSCEDPSDASFCSELIRKYGAVSIFRVNDTIPENVLPSFLRALCVKAKEIPPKSIHLPEFIKGAVSAAKTQATRNLDEELEILLANTTQLS
jgi:hypothetical protein